MIILLLNTVSVFCMSSRKMVMDEWTLWPLCPCKGPIHDMYVRELVSLYFLFSIHLIFLPSLHVKKSRKELLQKLQEYPFSSFVLKRCTLFCLLFVCLFFLFFFLIFCAIHGVFIRDFRKKIKASMVKSTWCEKCRKQMMFKLRKANIMKFFIT